MLVLYFYDINLLFYLLKVITSEQYTVKYWQLTEEGIETAEKGSHEAQLYNAIPSDGIAQAALMVSVLTFFLT